ncbi:MAG: hypothetical protein KDD82_20905 [Planctomycetes bacterium]|nr:hypothetical protein [Planctomycetota bacterium]
MTALRLLACVCLVATCASAQTPFTDSRSESVGPSFLGATWERVVSGDRNATSADAQARTVVHLRVAGRLIRLVGVRQEASWPQESRQRIELPGGVRFTLPAPDLSLNRQLFQTPTLTVPIGPVPVAFQARINGQIELDRDAVTRSGAASRHRFRGKLRLSGSADAGVGVAIAGTGVEGTLDLLDSETPADFTLSPSAIDYDVLMRRSANLRLAVYAQVGIGFLSRRVTRELFRYALSSTDFRLQGRR